MKRLGIAFSLLIAVWVSACAAQEDETDLVELDLRCAIAIQITMSDLLTRYESSARQLLVDHEEDLGRIECDKYEDVIQINYWPVGPLRLGGGIIYWLDSDTLQINEIEPQR